MKLTSLAIVAALALIGWTFYGSPPTAQAHEHDPGTFVEVCEVQISSYSPNQGLAIGDIPAQSFNYRQLWRPRDCSGVNIQPANPFQQMWIEGLVFGGHEVGLDSYMTSRVLADLWKNRGPLMMDSTPRRWMFSTCLIPIGKRKPAGGMACPAPAGADPGVLNQSVSLLDGYYQIVFAPTWDICQPGGAAAEAWESFVPWAGVNVERGSTEAAAFSDPDCVAEHPDYGWPGNPSAIGEMYVYDSAQNWVGLIEIPRCDPRVSTFCHANFEDRWWTTLTMLSERGNDLSYNAGVVGSEDRFNGPVKPINNKQEWTLLGFMANLTSLSWWTEYARADLNQDGGVGGPDFTKFVACFGGTCQDGSTQ